MIKSFNEDIIKSIQDFKLPKYEEIPNVGLYLEQTAKYISEYLAPLQDGAITGSMISNYVKKGLVSNPVKKQYNREQIAYFIFIAIAKNVLSMEDIGLLFEIQKKTYDAHKAYSYFERELRNVIEYVFGIKDNLDQISENNSGEKLMLRNTIITVAHKIYLDKYFAKLHKSAEEQDSKKKLMGIS